MPTSAVDVVFIGCGGIGSNAAEMMVRADLEAGHIEALGRTQRTELAKRFRNFFKPEIDFEITPQAEDEFLEGTVGYLYPKRLNRILLVDFDRVEEKNLTRQNFTANQVGDFKTNALADNLLAINPKLDVRALNLELKDNIDFALLPAEPETLWVLGTDSHASKALIVNKLTERLRGQTASVAKYLIANCDGASFELKNYRDASERQVWNRNRGHNQTGGYLNAQNSEANRMVALRIASYWSNYYRWAYNKQVATGRRSFDFVAFHEKGERVDGGSQWKLSRKTHRMIWSGASNYASFDGA